MKVPFAVFAFVLAVVPALSGAALADPPTAAYQGGGQAAPAAPGKFKIACASDIEKYCAQSQTHKEQRECVRQHRAAVSQTCSSFLVARHEQRVEMKSAQSAQTASATGH